MLTLLPCLKLLVLFSMNIIIHTTAVTANKRSQNRKTVNLKTTDNQTNLLKKFHKLNQRQQSLGSKVKTLITIWILRIWITIVPTFPALYIAPLQSWTKAKNPKNCKFYATDSIIITPCARSISVSLSLDSKILKSENPCSKWEWSIITNPSTICQ